MKKSLPPRFSKMSKHKQRRQEIQKAIKALRVMSNQPRALESMRAVVSADTVVVKLQRQGIRDLQAAALNQARTVYRMRSPKLPSEPPASLARTRDYVDASIAETERAVRTLLREPSNEVKEFYKRLAGLTA